MSESTCPECGCRGGDHGLTCPTPAADALRAGFVSEVISQRARAAASHTSERKARSSRANGAKGGRPKRQEPPAGARERA